MSVHGTLKTISLSGFLIPIYVRILLGSQPTPGAVSWMRADMCQRSGVLVSSVSQQRIVVTPLLQVVASSSNDDIGNSGYDCGTGTCSRPSWAKP